MKYTEITSRKNGAVAFAASLSDKRERDASGLFPIEGIKLFCEAVKEGFEIDSVFFTREALGKYAVSLESAEIGSAYIVTDEVYSRMTTEKAPQGIYACVKKKDNSALLERELEKGSLVILDGIQNPQNIGAIFRSAYSLGFDRIILSADCADIYGPKCSRAAMGSLFKVKAFCCGDIPTVIGKIRENGNRVFCAALSEKSKKLGDVTFLKGDCIVIGNEGHGVSPETLDACGNTLYIPMNEGAESLNAACAASLLFWEMRKSVLTENI